MEYVGMMLEEVMAMLDEQGVEYDYIGHDDEGSLYVGGYWSDGEVLGVEDNVVVYVEEFEWGDDL